MAGKPTVSYPEFREAAAQDARTPLKLDLVNSGDIEFTGDARPILRSADGSRWKISLDGNRITTEKIVS